MSKKILLIEDDTDIAKTTAAFLEDEGFEMVTAVDGMEGLHKARTIKPDLVIIDIMLPSLDGYKLCRMLKFDNNFKHIPVIIFTARAQETDKKLGKEVCADAYVTKPFDPQALIGKIKELLQ
ncbi:MAG: response regulator [Candidatus Omnitrophica bacterium]|nr:response regulator [Candidatus Omnitrophota bacterium]MBU1869906.1 response regulator [Candidatus Omnitrophota bacterium]